MEKIGCARPVVGIVVPSGYSFNLDGTCIYLTMAALFIAQATDTALTLSQQLGLARDAAASLKRGGKLLLVANRQLPYEAALEASGLAWRKITEDKIYKILSAEKRI